MDAGKPGGSSLGNLVDDNRGVVAHGLGVGHGAHIGVAALGSRAATALDGLLVLKAGVAEMHMTVHKTGRNRQSRRVKDLTAVGRYDFLRDFRNHAVVTDEHIAQRVRPRPRVEHAAILVK